MSCRMVSRHIKAMAYGVKSRRGGWGEESCNIQPPQSTFDIWILVRKEARFVLACPISSPEKQIEGFVEVAP